MKLWWKGRPPSTGLLSALGAQVWLCDGGSVYIWFKAAFKRNKDIYIYLEAALVTCVSGLCCFSGEGHRECASCYGLYLLDT